MGALVIPAPANLSPGELATAATLWISGCDTAEIAQSLSYREATIANAMPAIRRIVATAKLSKAAS